MKIVDASVALKWFVEERNGQQAAQSILKEIESNPSHFAVPELFFAEMLHVLCRLFANEAKAKEAIEILESLGFERIGLGHDLLSKAAELSVQHGVSGYDAIYAASAALTKGKWLTFDEKAHRKLSSLRISALVG